MAAAQYFEQVQKIFIAFYQRPADPAGLKYWAERVDAAGGNINEVINAFASSAEAVALYGAIDATTVRGVIDSLYTALFNVPADFDAAGKQFYVDGFVAGTFTAGTIALAVLNGAQNDDLIAVNNKVQVANEFTKQVDGRALTDAYFGTGNSFNVSYSGDADTLAARGILKAVTFLPSTVINPSQVTDALKAQIANTGDVILGQTSGQTFTLTTGLDTITGTLGNDDAVGTWTESATNVIGGTLSLGDKINGGDGTDSLTLTVGNQAAATTVVTGFTATSIEKIFVNATGAAAADTTTFNASAAKDATEFWSDGSGRAVIFGAAGDATQAITKNAAIGLKNTTQNVTATFADTLVSGTADTGTLALGGAVGSSAAQPTVTLNGVTAANGFETINVVSTGSANRIAQLNSGIDKIETVNLTGSANVRIDDVNSTATKKVDASGLTGTAAANINVATSTSTALAFTGSANADRVVLNGATANAANTFSLNGGVGSDTIAISTGLAFTQAANAALVTTVNKATAFEVLEATNAGTRALKANDFTAINEFVFGVSATAAAGAATIAITGVETADKFTIGADQAAAAGNVGGASASAATNALTFTGAGPGQTASVVLSSTTGVDVLGGAGGAGEAASGSAAGAAGAAAVAFGGAISTLTIESSGSAANTIVGGVGGTGGAGSGAGVGGAAAVAIDNGTSVQSVVITGSQNLSILGGAAGATGASSGGAGGAASLNAFSNSISVDATGLQAKLTIAGSAQADVIKVGTKGSEVRATEGADSVTLGAGNDVIVYTNVNQSLTSVADDAAILNSIDKISAWGTGVDKLDVDTVTGINGGAFTAAEFVAQNVVQAAVNAVGPTTLLQAAQAAAANLGADKIGAFQYGGNTYVLGQDNAAAFAVTDLLIQITGTQTLTADNFVFA